MYSDETNFANKRVTIIGAAREGTALAQFLCAQGARVILSDVQTEGALADHLASVKGLPITLALSGHPESILDADVVFVSPGVPLEIPILREAIRRGVPLSSETRLFFRLCPAPIVGITGSSGKTTTTAMTGEMLKVSGHRTWVGGNIGQPLIGHLQEIRPGDKVVMELSSFQLEMLGASPHIAAVLNITPNHLDRHGAGAGHVLLLCPRRARGRADGVGLADVDHLAVAQRSLAVGTPHAPREGSSAHQA